MALARVAWDIGDLDTKWTVNMRARRINATSVEPLTVSVAAYAAGLPYVPTAAGVSFAFLPGESAVPTSGDWHAGSWDTTLIGTYVAQISPGALPLTAGDYMAWLKIDDMAGSGAVVVRQLGTLFVD